MRSDVRFMTVGIGDGHIRWIPRAARMAKTIGLRDRFAVACSPGSRPTVTVSSREAPVFSIPTTSLLRRAYVRQFANVEPGVAGQSAVETGRGGG